MAKIQTTTVDGWPMMTPLGRREAGLLADELGEGETVLGQVIGTYSQTVVATATRVIVVKAGVMAGQIFGGTVTSYKYADIEGVELRMHLAQGEFEIVSRPTGGGEPPAAKSWMTAALLEQPHALVFGKLDAPAFTSLAAQIRERLAPQPRR